MKSRMVPFRPGLCALLAIMALSLNGCSMFETVGDLLSGPTAKSNLKGERISVLSLDQSLRPDPALAKQPILLPPPWRNPNWPEPGGYAANAMYHLEASGPLDRIWNEDAGKGSDSASHLTAPPVVVDGRIFVLDAEAHIYAFNAKDGNPLWNKRLAPKNGTDAPTLWGLLGTPNTVNPASGFGGGVATGGGKLFATTGFGEIFALDPATGRELWKDEVGIPIVNAPVVDGGRLFVSTDDNHFSAYATADGRRLWEHQGIPESAGILESTSAAVAGEFVIVPYTSGEIYALRVQNGEMAWSDILSHTGRVTSLSELDDIAGRPVVDRDLVFAISHSGLMVALNLATGERVWSRDIGGIQTPWAAGDYVYVLTGDQQIFCLTRKEGKVRWVHQLPAWSDPDDKLHPIVWAGPVLVSNRLIVTSSTGYAESISPYSGQLLGRMEIDGPTMIAPVVADGMLYLYTSDAELVALR